jgi:hypothetical protein
MSCRGIGAWIVGALLGVYAGGAEAQVTAGPLGAVGRNPAYFATPGAYGMGYGVPSFGYPRTYTAFSSPFGGASYGYGYGQYAFLPGHYGVGLWRPGAVTPGYVYGAGYYRTFPVPYRPLVPFRAPTIGNYAPGFGPPSYYYGY